jgi:uncharacterized membrane protein YfcA
MSPLLLFAVITVSIFTQSVTGFGLALISMPLLIQVMGVQAAAPLIALVAITAEVVLLVRYRHAIQFQTVRRLSVASVIGVPFGVFVLANADERVVLGLLGIIVTGYALYALVQLRLPAVQHPGWAYGFGFVGGILSGAYNTAGPPIVIYGSCRRWTPAQFKSNLQGYFIINSLMVIATHTLAHNYTEQVWQSYLIALPGVIVGLALGFSLDRFINPLLFRKIVLLLLVVIGLRLIF